MPVAKIVAKERMRMSSSTPFVALRHRFRNHLRFFLLFLVLSQSPCGAEEAADPYDILYDVLMTRYGPDGEPYARDESSPAIHLLSEFPFGDKTLKDFNTALDAFVALPQEAIEAYSVVERALLQRHLWEVFDATFPIPARWGQLAEYEGSNRELRELRLSVRKRLLTQDRRAVFRPKIALLIQRLALTKEQILGLPNTRVATVKSGGFDQRHDPKDAVKPFFPADLYSDESSWICLGQVDDPIPADKHSGKLKWRSTFLSFMRVPGGRGETLNYLQKMSNENVFPVGTQFALIEQAFLISDEGELVLSPLVVSISLRAFLDVTRPPDGATILNVTRQSDDGHPKATQSVAEFVMQPRQLLQGNAVMKAIGPHDHRYETGFDDPFDGEADPFETGKIPNETSHRLNLCMRCHVQGVSSIRTANPRNVLREGASPKAIIRATSLKKRDHETWKGLHEFWRRKG